MAGYLGLANGLGFLAGATVGYFLLRANLNPPGGRLIGLQVVRTILVTICASLIAGLIAHVVDQLLGLESLTRNWGGVGSLLRLVVLGLIMMPTVAGGLAAPRRYPRRRPRWPPCDDRLGRSRARSRGAAPRRRRPTAPSGQATSRTLIGGQFVRARSHAGTARRRSGADPRRR